MYIQIPDLLLLNGPSGQTLVKFEFNSNTQHFIQRGLIYHDITYNTAITVAESESVIRITRDTPYLALTGELWDVYCASLGENWSCYNGTALHSETNAWELCQPFTTMD